MIGLKESFPMTSLEQWVERLKKDLKSEDLHELNFSDAIEDVTYISYQHADNTTFNKLSPGAFPYTRGLEVDSNNWSNGFEILVEDEKNANKKALEVLMKGVDSLHIMLPSKKIDLKVLLTGIGLEHIQTTFYTNDLQTILEILDGPAFDYPSNVSLAIDPHLFENWNDEQIIGRLKEKQVPVILIDGFNMQQCGANISQELAFILSTAYECLLKLINKGLTIDEAAACLHFRIGIGSNYFMEIAKTRTLRTLWAKVIRHYNPMHNCTYNCRITAKTGSMNKSALDPNTNLLRQTTESMSAIIGGVNQLIVTPFDQETINGTTALSERMAINISLILKEESYLDIVIDPAGGSYSIEKLTNLFGEKTWSIFGELDSLGGVFENNALSMLIEQIKKKAEIRIDQVRKKEKTLIGINKFNNPSPENNSFKSVEEYLGLNKLILERDI